MKDILEKDYFSINEEDGTSKTYSTLFTFYSQEYNKNYVVYSDYIDNINAFTNKSIIYASIYNPDDEFFNIINITDKEELDMVKQQIDEIMMENINEPSIYDREVSIYDSIEI